MKLFSMDWFRSTKKEMEETENKLQDATKSIENLEVYVGELASSVDELRDVVAEAVNKLVDHVLEADEETTENFEDVKEEIDILRKATRTPLIKNLKLVGDVIIMTTQDGNVITKPNATREDFNNIKNATSEEDLEACLHTDVKKDNHESEVTEEEFLTLLHHKDFIKRDGCIYMKEVPNRSIPELLVRKFSECIGTDEYDNIKKFWLKCCLNPNAQSAEDLYAFLKTHNMKIDRHGNFYAYRRVVSLNTEVDKKLVDFVSNAYNKVKAVWKKRSSDYSVCLKDGEYRLHENSVQWEASEEFVGYLHNLYRDLPNLSGNRYTDAHTHKEDYRVGEIISMPRYNGDDNNSRSCSKGYHQASRTYNYSGFGDTPILSIVSPIDVLAVPVGETGKLRCCRWFFAMTLDEDEKYILDEEGFDVTDLGDVFEEKYLKNAHEFVMNNFAEEVKRHTFNIPNINTQEIKNTLDVLNSMYNVVKNRVKTL